MRLNWKDSENNQQRTSEVYLGEWKDRDKRGETAIYRDEQLARIEDFTERLLDLLDYYPSDPNEKLSDNEEQKLFLDLKMEHYDGPWSTEYKKQRDRWNTDMLKLYFAGEGGQNVVLTCIAGGTWINATGEWQTHPCKIQRPDHPAKALQMIEAHLATFYTLAAQVIRSSSRFARTRQTSTTLHKHKYKGIVARPTPFRQLQTTSQGYSETTTHE